MDNNDDFSKTKEIDSLDNFNNQIIEVENKKEEKDLNTEINANPNNFFTEPKKEKLKDKIKKFWNRLNTKGKVLIISIIVLVIALIGVGIFFIIKGSKKEEPTIEPPKVIKEEENYRYENGELVFLNLNKEEIGRYTCNNKDENACFISFYTNEDEFDKEKILYEDNTPVLFRTNIILDTYAFINDGGNLIKLYNLKTNNIIGSYLAVKKVDNNKMILKNESNLYGMMEFTSEDALVRLDFSYNYLGYIENEDNYYIAKDANTSKIIDSNGKILLDNVIGDIKDYNSNYVKVLTSNNKEQILNYNNQNVFNEAFDYVSIYDDFAALVNDGSLYLRFYDNNKLLEDAIFLKNRNYVKSSIYNKDKALVKTNNSFDIRLDGNLINIDVYDNDNKTSILVNKSEGELNKSLRNLSYFDGKLYIYLDSNKTNLLGSYTCVNKNEVDSKTKKLENCYIAKDTVLEDNDYEILGEVGVIPVFNERFIFINDNDGIVLYDLKKNSIIGKYKEVNTYSYTNTDDLTFQNVNNTKVVLKNNTNNYGVVRITSNEIIGHIGFNYSELEKCRDMYIARDANGYLLLDGNNGASKTSAIRYKIRDYNDKYVKVKRDDGKYYIYKYDNERSINERGYKYVELYDNYFAGVNENNMLGVYLYNDLENNLISGSVLVQLNSTDYYGKKDVAFSIRNDKLSIKDSTDTYDIIIPKKEEN